MIELLAELLFGRDCNGGPCLLDGWSFPEDGFVWSVGAESRLQIPVPPLPPSTAPILELDINPFIEPGRNRGQRFEVLVNGVPVGADLIEGSGIVGYRIPPALLASGGTLLIQLHHPDAVCPADLGVNGDDRQLGFMLRSAAVVAVGAEPNVRQHVLPPLDLPDMRNTGALKTAVAAYMGESAAQMMVNFESLGQNCEFGIMQRQCGADPAGLLCFADISLYDLLRGLDCGFAGVGDEPWLQVCLHEDRRREIVVYDTRHNIIFHSFRFDDETAAEQVRAQESRKIRHRHCNFKKILRTGEKLFVYQQPGRLLPAHMLPLLTQLRAYGRNALLFVTEGSPHPPGTVAQIGDGLYQGFIGARPPSQDVGGRDLRVWLSICTNALALWRAQSEFV